MMSRMLDAKVFPPQQHICTTLVKKYGYGGGLAQYFFSADFPYLAMIAQTQSSQDHPPPHNVLKKTRTLKAKFGGIQTLEEIGLHSIQCHCLVIPEKKATHSHNPTHQ